ncbi:hypothetical protein [Streptomyces sp. BK340]|uniref:hypothetical protein n=1 Tax=Streptomyces sp. BK340 TaxID=2572903 RepID=UPI0021BDD14E|nr:hypothetical protein [Streptomyces sp. BK340]
MRTLAGLSIACAALLAPLTGCTSDHPEAKKPARPARSSDPGSASTTATTTATATPGSSAQPSAPQPPELDADETLAGRQKATTGNASIAFAKGRKGDALIVAVRCQGAGRIKVAVRPVHASFRLECLAGKASTTYNQLDLGGAAHSGVASVEAPSSVRWSMTIGRGAPVQEEIPTVTTESR